jgi:hypothetical protein
MGLGCVPYLPKVSELIFSCIYSFSFFFPHTFFLLEIKSLWMNDKYHGKWLPFAFHIISLFLCASICWIFVIVLLALVLILTYWLIYWEVHLVTYFAQFHFWALALVVVVCSLSLTHKTGKFLITQVDIRKVKKECVFSKGEDNFPC